MKIAKIIAIAALVYIGIVAAFETLIGTLQPQNEDTLVISVTDENGDTNDRVLSRLEVDGNVYVAVNHWPRAWYHNALERPDVSITYGGETAAYRAVPVEGAEHDVVNTARPLGLVTRFLMGFAPRYFLRLEAA